MTVARFQSCRSAWCTARRCIVGVLALVVVSGAAHALAWDPPREGEPGRCRLEKRGSVVRGWAEITVAPRTSGSRVTCVA